MSDIQRVTAKIEKLDTFIAEVELARIQQWISRESYQTVLDCLTKDKRVLQSKLTKLKRDLEDTKRIEEYNKSSETFDTVVLASVAASLII